MGPGETVLLIIYGTISMGALLAWYGRAAEDKNNEFGFCLLVGIIGALLWPLFFSVFLYQGLESFLQGFRDL